MEREREDSYNRTKDLGISIENAREQEEIREIKVKKVVVKLK